ncbi:hypothetical protein SA2016_0314 [Sinomonas atrocyanea]|uniref:Uncharacterized protein n=1 Tax=Sinomonas atrocyanea TaxID=37927 RepID=A0A126ZX90_9MICC|nr:hypothetical protein SA2016_0314 [Sinomonas atrocyanea]GEB63262.1 hypothetical protein SAT01_07100 [Sinomonas atrocyanea]GGG69582.1 hypothetical protein GCM10007172_22150 [Sinomonas atrocyanea]
MALHPTVPSGKRNVGVDRPRLGLQIVLQYEGRWDLLGTPTNEVLVLLPRRFRELALDSKIGLPPEHPWKQDLPEW